MIRKVLIVIITATLWVSGAALAGGIYKWTDEDGNVHYEDRPVGEQVEIVKIISNNTNNDSVQASVDARHDRETARAEARSKYDEDQQAAAKAEAEAAQRDVKCQESRSRMQTYLHSQRLYKQDDAGERVYLDEDQTRKVRADAQDMIHKYCD